MFLTQEDYRKIESWLKLNSKKDTDFDFVDSIDGTETVTIVQGNKNKRIFLRDFINEVGNPFTKDLVNVSADFGLHGITLETAIQAIPLVGRKEGLVITFEDTDSNWRIHQFIGELPQWNLVEQWQDVLNQESFAVDSLLPDEEDITATESDDKGNAKLKFADKEYNPDAFSGLGYVILRKNLVEVMGPETGESRGIVNLLYQDMIKKENTVYEIKYDFDLNGQTITIPSNCTLKFNGGSIINGELRLNNSIISSEDICFSGITFQGTLKSDVLSSWFTNLNEGCYAAYKLGKGFYINRNAVLSTPIQVYSYMNIYGNTKYKTKLICQGDFPAFILPQDGAVSQVIIKDLTIYGGSFGIYKQKYSSIDKSGSMMACLFENMTFDNQTKCGICIEASGFGCNIFRNLHFGNGHLNEYAYIDIKTRWHNKNFYEHIFAGGNQNGCLSVICSKEYEYGSNLCECLNNTLNNFWIETLNMQGPDMAAVTIGCSGSGIHQLDIYNCYTEKIKDINGNYAYGYAFQNLSDNDTSICTDINFHDNTTQTNRGIAIYGTIVGIYLEKCGHPNSQAFVIDLKPGINGLENKSKNIKQYGGYKEWTINGITSQNTNLINVDTLITDTIKFEANYSGQKTLNVPCFVTDAEEGYTFYLIHPFKDIVGTQILRLEMLLLPATHASGYIVKGLLCKNSKGVSLIPEINSNIPSDTPDQDFIESVTLVESDIQDKIAFNIKATEHGKHAVSTPCIVTYSYKKIFERLN